MNRFLVLLMALFLLLGYPSDTYSQSDSAGDSVFYETSINNALSRGLKFQKSINIGFEYIEPGSSFRNGHQFFLSEEALPGEVRYNNIQYDHVDLQYDLVLDELIIENFANKKIILVKENVGQFVLKDQFFMNLSDFNSDSKMKPGYYQVLVNRPDVKLLAKRIKLIKGDAAQIRYHKTDLQIEYKVKYYLVKSDSYYPVKKSKEISKLLFVDGKSPKIKSRKMSKEDRMVALFTQYRSAGDEE